MIHVNRAAAEEARQKYIAAVEKLREELGVYDECTDCIVEYYDENSEIRILKANE